MAAAGGDTEDLVPAYRGKAVGKWKTLKTSVDTANMTLSGSTTHVGTWAVLARTTSASNGMPAWGWVFLGIGAVAGLGALVYLALFMRPTKQPQRKMVRPPER